MRWIPLESFRWESPLTVPELRERLAGRSEKVRLFWTGRNVEFTGRVSDKGFQLSPTIKGHISFQPQLLGRWQNSAAGSRIDLEIVPNAALFTCLTIVFAFLGILVYEQNWGRVALTTAACAVLSWLLLQMGHRSAARIVERRLMKLLESTPRNAAEPIPSPSPRSGPFPHVKWLAPIAALTLGQGVWWQVYTGRLAISTRPVVDLVCVYWITQTVLYVWLMSLSGLHPSTRVRWLAGLFVLEIGWASCVAVHGYTGDARPILAWRWSPRYGSQFAHLPPTAKPRSTAEVDLRATGPHDFPGFRGSQRNGVVRDVQLDPNWQRLPPRIVWDRAIGPGWSSFAVVGAFAVTQEQHGDDEAVVCYEAATGRVCWEHRDPAYFYEMMGGGGPRATPTIHDGRVYALGATGILNCLEGRDGSVVWSVNVLAEKQAANSLFGMAGSPLIWRGLVIVSPGIPGASVAAYDRHTGRQVWGAGDAAASYASPMLAKLRGVEQVLSFNAEGLFAHALDDGRVLWSFPWITPPERNNVCQPVLWIDEQGQETVFIASGYGKGCTLLDIGRNEAGFAVTSRWQSKQLKTKFTSVVEQDGYVYGLDENILCCLDLRTGRRRRKAGRYGYGQVMLLDRTVLVLSEDGEIVLCEANPDEHREIARVPVLEGRTWNHPALAGRRLLIRNDRRAACLEFTGADPSGQE